MPSKRTEIRLPATSKISALSGASFNPDSVKCTVLANVLFVH